MSIVLFDFFIICKKPVNPQITKEKLLEKAQQFKYFTRVFTSINPFIEWNEKNKFLKLLKLEL